MIILRRWGALACLVLMAGATAQAMPRVAGPGSAHGSQPLIGLGSGAVTPTGWRALDVVRASDEQKDQVEAIWRSAHQALRPMHQAQRELQRQMAELMNQPEVDGAAAEALRQRIVAGHDGISRRWLQARLEASAVFTAVQRARLADWHAERRQRQELQLLRRHHRPLAPEWRDDELQG